eukprot:GHVT01102378.1.p1 GENE.GHVT01102378.1~~GHVT01102378.1.p1  ORF type:complete len:1455 (-),score=175.23 GHVT01102378.1:1567-5931(-)
MALPLPVHSPTTGSSRVLSFGRCGNLADTFSMASPVSARVVGSEPLYSSSSAGVSTTFVAPVVKPRAMAALSPMRRRSSVCNFRGNLPCDSPRWTQSNSGVSRMTSGKSSMQLPVACREQLETLPEAGVEGDTPPVKKFVRFSAARTVHQLASTDTTPSIRPSGLCSGIVEHDDKLQDHSDENPRKVARKRLAPNPLPEIPQSRKSCLKMSKEQKSLTDSALSPEMGAKTEAFTSSKGTFNVAQEVSGRLSAPAFANAVRSYMAFIVLFVVYWSFVLFRSTHWSLHRFMSLLRPVVVDLDEHVHHLEEQVVGNAPGLGLLRLPPAPPDSILGHYYSNLHVGLEAFLVNGLKQAGIVGVVVAIVAIFALKTRGKHSRTSSVLQRLFGVFCAVNLFVHITTFFFGGLDSKSVGFPDVFAAALTDRWHALQSTVLPLAATGKLGLGPWAVLFPSLFSAGVTPGLAIMLVISYLIGFAIDLLGVAVQVYGVLTCLRKRDLVIPAAILGVVMGIGGYFLAATPTCNGNDHHWVSFEQLAAGGAHDFQMGKSPSYPPVRTSHYVTMADGVEIALDLYLPRNMYNDVVAQHQKDLIAALSSDEDIEPPTMLSALGKTGLPTYLDITRYNRRTPVYYPFSMISIWNEPRGASVNVWSWQFPQALVPNGYAVVVADTRGSGGSFGTRPVDFSEEELSDFAILVEWSKTQWWSNGKLGVGGISYDGMTGLQAAAQGGVDAAISLFTPTDVLGDLFAPGGVVCSAFLEDYSGLTAGFEQRGTPVAHILKNPLQFPLHVALGFISTFGRSVAVFEREGDVESALLEHEQNWEMGELVQQVEFLDDHVTLGNNQTMPVAQFGIQEEVMSRIAQHNVSLYIVGGYCDSAITRGAARLYSFIKREAPESKSRLVLGSWTHSGRRNCSPYSGSYPCFEQAMYFDIVRHLDCHLKGDCWGDVATEPPVHYWQVGEEQWHTSEHYPPAEEAAMAFMELGLTNNKYAASENIERRLSPQHEEATFSLADMDESSALLRIRAPQCSEASDAVNDPASVRQCTVNDYAETIDVGCLDGVTTPAYHAQTHAPRSTFPSIMNMRNTLLEHYLHDLMQWFWLHLIAGDAEKEHSAHWQTLTQEAETHVRLDSKEAPTQQAVVAQATAKLIESDQNAYSLSLRTHRHIKHDFKNGAKKTATRTHLPSQAHGASILTYEVDYRATSGTFSRWAIAQHPFRILVHYGNRLFSRREPGHVPPFLLGHSRNGADEISGASETVAALAVPPVETSPTPASPISASVAQPLSWTSARIASPVRMVGSAWVRFHMFVQNCTDVSVFVYLEDVDLETGFAHYVTEGKMVASHRPFERMPPDAPVPIGSSDIVHRSYAREHYRQVDSAGELLEINLTLEPTSWTFQPGHAVRVTMVGSDTDNFSIRSPDSTVLPRYWQIVVPDNDDPNAAPSASIAPPGFLRLPVRVE